MWVNLGATTIWTMVWVEAGHHVIGMMVGRIATVIVMIAVSVVVRIHRWLVVRVICTMAWRRRHRWTKAVIVEAVAARTVVVADARSHSDHHTRLVAIAVPAEADRLEVLESGETVELAIQFIVRHHRVGH